MAGEMNVNGHSLAFVERDIDWRIWIENGPQLTPCSRSSVYYEIVANPG